MYNGNVFDEGRYRNQVINTQIFLKASSSLPTPSAMYIFHIELLSKFCFTINFNNIASNNNKKVRVGGLKG